MPRRKTIKSNFTPSKINNNNLKDKSNEDRQRFRAFR